MIAAALGAAAAATPAAATTYPPPSIHPAVHGSGQQRHTGGQRVRAAPRSHDRPENAYSATIAVSKARKAGASVAFALTAGSLPPA
jgi:hypothetical protein